MKELVIYIVKQLVTNPDAVSVDETNSDGRVELVLNVDPQDIGMVIGRSGQTIKAIRKLVIVRAMAEHVRVNLRVNEPPRTETTENTEAPAEE